MSHLAYRLSYTRTPVPKNCLSIVKNSKQSGFEHSQALQKASILDRLIEFFKRVIGLKSQPQQQQSCTPPLHKIHLQVNTDLNELDRILRWLDQLEHLPIPKTVWWQCQLALVEGFTNAVRHAHKGLPMETPIDLEVTVFQESLEIRIWDYGTPFDLEAKLKELREVERDPLDCGGGNGLRLILKMADRVDYKRTSNRRNYLVVVKRLLPSANL